MFPVLALLAPPAPLSAAHPGGQQPLPARLHPPDAVVYVEVPDFGALVEAYAQAPMVRFARDPSGREAASQIFGAAGLDLQQVGLHLAELLGISEQEAAGWGEAPAQLFAALGQRLRSISFSVSFHGSPGEAVGGAVELARSAGAFAILELDSEASAAAVAGWIARTAERLKLVPHEESSAPSLAIREGEPGGARFQVFGSKTEPVRSVWSLAWGRRLALGSEPADAAALTERWSDEEAPSLAQHGEFARLRARLSGPQGTTVAQGFCDLDSILDRLDPDWAAALRPLGAARAWRTELRGDRFVSEVCGAAGAATFFGGSPIPAGLWAFAPADAIALAAATLDERASIRRWALERIDAGDSADNGTLRELEEIYDFDLQRDVIENLGPGLLLYVLPITGLPPSGAAVLEIRDPHAFERALRGLLAQLEDRADGAYTLRYRPYQPPGSSDEVPMWIASFGGMSPVSPSLAILDRHLLVTTTSLRAKREIRRILAGKATAHPLAAASLPEDARLAGYIDWRAVLDGAYTSARGLLSLASLGSIGGAMPLDLKAMPADAGALTQFLKPTISWSRSTPEGNRSRLESSFGPETWIAPIALALFVVPSSPGTSEFTVIDPAPGQGEPSSDD